MGSEQHHDKAFAVGVAVAVVIIVGLIILITVLYQNLLFDPRRIIPHKVTTHNKYNQPLLGKRSCKDRWLSLRGQRSESGDAESIHIRTFMDYPGRDLVLFCHGSTGNIEDRNYIVEMTQIMEFNLVLFDYRGYGKSNGIPNERKILEDCATVYQHICECLVPESKIVVWGVSLGGAPATYVAASTNCKKLVLLSTFASLSDIALYSDIPDYFRGTVTPYLMAFHRNLPSKVWIRQVRCPVLIVHSKEDSVIPHINSELLYQNITHRNKTLLTIKGDHPTPCFNKRQFRTMIEFLGRTTQKPNTHKTSKSQKINKEIEMLSLVLHNFQHEYLKEKHRKENSKYE